MLMAITVVFAGPMGVTVLVPVTITAVAMV
jgi:hypothetical protein